MTGITFNGKFATGRYYKEACENAGVPIEMVGKLQTHLCGACDETRGAVAAHPHFFYGGLGKVR